MSSWNWALTRGWFLVCVPWQPNASAAKAQRWWGGWSGCLIYLVSADVYCPFISSRHNSLGRMLICTHELHNSEPRCNKSHQLRKGLMKVAPSEIVQVDAFIISGYYWDGDELCVLSIAMNKRRVRNLVVGCEIALHNSRKCGPTWLCFKMRKHTVS